MTMHSFWLETAPGRPYPEPTGDVEVDVAVVGGGIAGLSAAWELTRAGRSVAVLEAGRVAAGVTGHTTAKLSSLHTLIYARLSASAGTEAARLYARSQQEAVEHVARTTAELGVDCDLEPVPAFTYAESDETLEQVRAEAEAAREAGLAASFVTGTPLPFPVAGAVRVEGQAQFHPRRYLLGLLEAMTARGALVFENSRVVKLDEGTPCRVTTAGGTTVTARDVVVATHYPVFDRSLLFTRMEPHRELVVAVPIPADRDPGGMFITTEQGTRSVRTAPYDGGRRLLIVTGESFKPGTGGVGERFARLEAWTAERFGADRITYRWAAQDNGTTDRLPFVGPLHPGARHAYVATGFGGWGMSNGVMSGLLLAALISGEERPWSGLYDPRRLHPLREAAQMVKFQASVAKHFVGDRLGSGPVGAVADLGRGQGAVLKVGGRRSAVYRDENGEIHAVSAVCTHLGCVVGFNDAERTWECPCHGSRFGVDGSVLQGPAVDPLRRLDVDADGNIKDSTDSTDSTDTVVSGDTTADADGDTGVAADGNAGATRNANAGTNADAAGNADADTDADGDAGRK
ncbi:glycine/D-amino acid oxidase-like deaminating enzyme/nitrite reductase/ring-hydroxylating ferredoxin subunit [Streptosporangium becharense]|uniref:Glycine/D-amino acid oxidase-like deaminating enzyme/nitrite reductase/ring-hydroxylating ferredoxin subunit n=1 Tax=Streptosporangium becharense TaxID=1816182 RepID=A0A7W9IKM4_9ACTN|nr:FAD-dependent oxidoreductase [Streptosporangium becharense]MBB2911099.1 glycine/D-amino acid oxidase-like deaminating enzyme/nitrite reductase/ring-hydroxylating ferredoxin subunit [Streptosporangium becharense]MBB5821843.1 glycine/D-amino acid oxidase-like deaminating enzyme/nitrite reductase/ring-hydroxylating ferredoxin subunit [Streptosporangium becharense]